MKYDLILHITTKENFNQHKAEGEYKPESLEEEGFIHCSTGEQLEEIANRLYSGEEEILILVIDPAWLDEEKLRYEPAEDGKGKFPHVHAPLNLGAIIDKLEVKAEKDGSFDIKFNAYS